MANGSYRQVLVGTDGSPTSLRAVDRAAEIARATGASLLVVAAYQPSGAEQRYDATVAAAVAQDALRTAVERPTTARIPVETLAVEGEPVEVLVTTAQERGVDLLVVGNRGMHSLSGRLLGSLPSVAAHRTPCDILIVATS